MGGEVEHLAWIETWARRIESKGLASMALLLIAIARPFGILGGQALVMAQPLLSGIVDDVAVERTVALMDNPGLLDQLRVRLEGGGE